MIVVGVTGKYCTGKSTVSDLLAEHGYVQIDVDRLGHEALDREQDRVIAAFGDSVRGDDGSVDRKQLGRLVFASEERLRELESILHPTMVAMTEDRVEEVRRLAGADAPTGVVINAAILFRMGLDRLCDVVLLVTAPFFTIWRRAKERDDASLRQVVRRLRSQHDVDPQHSSAHADTHSVENHGDRERLRRELARLLPLP